MIDIYSTNTMTYLTDSGKMFRRMQKKLCDYFDCLGGSRDVISKVNRASSPEQLIDVYVDWYYRKYLYHHNEQFIDLYEFIVSNMAENSDRIICLCCPFGQCTDFLQFHFGIPLSQLFSLRF